MTYLHTSYRSFAHVLLTLVLHHFRSKIYLSAVSNGRPVSSLIRSSQRLGGLPLLRFFLKSSLCIRLTKLFSGLRHTCPNHVKRLFLTISITVPLIPAFECSLGMDTLSCNLIPSSFLRQLFLNTWRVCRSSSLRLHVSDA